MIHIYIIKFLIMLVQKYNNKNLKNVKSDNKIKNIYYYIYVRYLYKKLIIKINNKYIIIISENNNIIKKIFNNLLYNKLFFKYIIYIYNKINIFLIIHIKKNNYLTSLNKCLKN